MRILAVIGRESHTTSRGWAKVEADGKRLGWRDATSHRFLTKYGDKHAFWVECVFEVEEGATVRWEAGRNSGARGADRKRQNLTLVADPIAPMFETENLGYPAGEAVLKGNLQPPKDALDADNQHHEALVNQFK